VAIEKFQNHVMIFRTLNHCQRTTYHNLGSLQLQLKSRLKV